MYRPAAILALALTTSALAAGVSPAHFRAQLWSSWHVQVVLERVVEQSDVVVQAHKTLGAYDLVTTRERGGLRVEAQNVVIVGDTVEPADALTGFALGAWAPYHVAKNGLFVGMATADVPAGVDADTVAAGARRQWTDLVQQWEGRLFVAGTAELTAAHAERSTETIAVDVPCGEATCVRVDRITTFAPTAAQLEGITVGSEGTLLGWTDHLRATFEPDGLVPHELATERTVRFSLPGQAAPVERIDRSTRRFTPS